jgi:DNA-binding LytR/AlgR family response regulator
LHKKTLTTLEQMLPAHFERVHRSHIVNLHFAAQLGAGDGGRRVLTLANGSSVPLSRASARKLRG